METRHSLSLKSWLRLWQCRRDADVSRRRFILIDLTAASAALDASSVRSLLTAHPRSLRYWVQLLTPARRLTDPGTGIPFRRSGAGMGAP